MFLFCSWRDRRQDEKPRLRSPRGRGFFASSSPRRIITHVIELGACGASEREGGAVIIKMSARVGPVAYELTDIPPRLVDGDDGITYISYTLRNARLEGQQISIMMAPDEIDRLYAAKQKLARGRR
jgi:hypothetical protein